MCRMIHKEYWINGCHVIMRPLTDAERREFQRAMNGTPLTVMRRAQNPEAPHLPDTRQGEPE